MVSIYPQPVNIFVDYVASFSHSQATRR